MEMLKKTPLCCLCLKKMESEEEISKNMHYCCYNIQNVLNQF